ncbi:MAG: agmatine deiminase family protein [candidate division Zixibacteria bacterium]|nr:agmatine deiminase family protein [candidate division Zixibacteria bacterium]
MKKINLLLIPLFFILLSLSAFALDDSEQEFLPIGLTEEEMLRLDEIGVAHRATAPPSGEARNASEWERSQGVIIRWPLGISISLVAELSEDVVVTTIVSGTSEENSARSAYTSGGVNMEHVDFLHASTNSIWTRDYGPWFIFEDGALAIVDHVYNRPRPLDDVIPQILGAEWGLPVYGMSLNHTGGNHMSDGLGMSMSTELVYDENTSLAHKQVDSIMLAYLGNDYTVLDYIESGGIHHIDCWAKFLNPTTILVKDVPTSSSSYALLNARADYLSQQVSAWGEPYTVVRVYCPYGTAYTNSLILNDKVFVPIFGSSWDDDAIATYQNAMPGYEILGFTGSWLDDDAIHCRTMGVPDRYMLFIDHDPLVTVSDTATQYAIAATIEASSGEALIAESLKVYFSVNAGSWDWVMLEASKQKDSYLASIPQQAPGDEIRYYIKAADLSGRIETHPFIGAPWAHTFSVYTELQITTADLPDWTAGETFSQQLEAVGGIGTKIWSDKFNDLTSSGLSLSSDGLLSGIPSSAGPISFLARVIDDNDNVDEQSYGFTINDAIAIDNSELPEGSVGVAYAYQLVAAGGTGTLSWTDRDLDLEGRGLTLSISGLVSGVPTDSGTVSFTARAVDAIGAFDEQEFSIYVSYAYVCGDANGDESVNLLDVLHIIDYLYSDPAGPAPIPSEAGDANADDDINLLDILYIIDYLYGSPPGPEPLCP